MNGDRVELREGTLVLIQRGDTHEIRNTGEAPLKTLNVYVPPAYTDDGEELPAGRATLKPRRHSVNDDLHGSAPDSHPSRCCWWT